MADLLVYTIGFHLPSCEGMAPLTLKSKASFLDADIIAIRPDLGTFYSHESYQGKPLLAEHDSFAVHEAHADWRDRIQSAINAGKTVFFFLPLHQKVYVDTGQRSHSGTGRNRQTTRHVDTFDNYRFIPVKFDNLRHETGSAISKTKDIGALAPLYHEFEEFWRYHTMYDSERHTPTLVTKSGGRPVGSLISKSVVLLPDLSFAAEFGVRSDGKAFSDPERKRLSLRLRDQLIGVHRALRSERVVTPPPQWASEDQYRICGERPIEDQIVAIKQQTDELSAQLSDALGRLGALGSLRSLLYETGPALEDAVRQALEILGFAVTKLNNGSSEFDAIFEGPEGRFIGEVEGKNSKAVNVAKISQIRRNIDEDFSRDEVDIPAIGVLFGNGFRLAHPNDRPSVFTDKVLSSAPMLGVSLVPTTELFRVAQHALASDDPNFKESCRRAFKAGLGQVVSFPPTTTEDALITDTANKDAAAHPGAF